MKELNHDVMIVLTNKIKKHQNYEIKIFTFFINNDEWFFVCARHNQDTNHYRDSVNSS